MNQERFSGHNNLQSSTHGAAWGCPANLKVPHKCNAEGWPDVVVLVRCEYSLAWVVPRTPTTRHV